MIDRRQKTITIENRDRTPKGNQIKIKKERMVIFNDADSNTYFMYFRMRSDIFDIKCQRSRV
jgi:hypothetical protein